jgi:hypothetical protein
VADLPPSYCYLKGQLISAVSNYDADPEPDSVARNGLTITVRALLTPRVVTWRAGDLEIDMSDITGSTDNAGRFQDDEGNKFIGFLAPDESLIPEVWKVTVTITGSNYTTRSKTFIPVANTPETALEWTDIIEVAPTTPGELAAAQQLLVDMAAIRTGAEAARFDALAARDEAQGFADSLDPSDFARLVQLARDPDQIIVGVISRNSNDVITAAGVRWPDGTLGAFTTDEIDDAGAINAYHITYGSPPTRTFTQPTMTRNASGAVTVLPQIVVT